MNLVSIEIAKELLTELWMVGRIDPVSVPDWLEGIMTPIPVPEHCRHVQYAIGSSCLQSLRAFLEPFNLIVSKTNIMTTYRIERAMSDGT